ncbi:MULTISPECIES: hypothetical protein [unclassified Frigoribacterium]|uniref:hypothetical protein n=1 Tax=unclassified Frigoribacterium TaxID=2627005 RepID=UPI0006F693A1|nr:MULTISPECIES: hypothetical protein [unclassified Frigoribacterium]KQO48713.1 hypothetical protein ASF07_09555 [Frigoribacterium sp. Leaf254]KQT40925.1 hypothetical protein ASG28_09560 [Frigoribacterium sp. Leaf415]
MPEPIAAWWARRRTSRGLAVPYPVGSYREAWASYPVLVRQYRPEYNGGIVLSQIPPAADVWLCWLCDSGHVFVATPDEQRHRPGRERRRSSWCPECSELAAPRALPMRPPMAPAAVVRAQAAGMPGQGSVGPVQGSDAPAPVSGAPAQAAAAPGQAGAARSPGGAVPAPPSPQPRRRRASSTGLPSTTPRAEPTRVARPDPVARPDRVARPTRASRPDRVARPTRASRPVCDKTPAVPTGTPFVSACAPKPASAVEAELRAELTARLEFEPGLNAVRVGRPFFDHVEVWPDIVLSELRVAIEYDSTGRHGLEHVGHRETADRRKDAALRAAGWEVVRLRTGKLPPLGSHDLQLSGLTRQTVPLLLDELRAIRGPLLVDAYLRR